MSRTYEIDKIVDEIGDADSLYEFAEGIYEDRQRISELEAKLAEKDKEIEKLNACVDFYKSYYISFKEKVIDELEKVKSAFGLINSKLDKVETIKEYIHYIDHQIKELKEGK